MAVSEPSRIGKRGTFVIPAKLRRIFGFDEGAQVIVEETSEGVLIRPAMTVPVELYGLERRAELLLSNAVDDDDYERALAVVRGWGVDPSGIAHHRPGGS